MMTVMPLVSTTLICSRSWCCPTAPSSGHACLLAPLKTAYFLILPVMVLGELSRTSLTFHFGGLRHRDFDFSIFDFSCSLLKIWNMNKYSGVLGVYNCQGAAWNSVERKNTFHQTNSEAITGYVRGRDVHLIAEAAVDSNWNGNVALYAQTTGALTTLQYNVAMPVSLKVLEHEVFTVTPVKVVAPDVSFAPLGLIDMFNGGGAIEGLKYETGSVVSLEVKGCGRFGAYSSCKPRKVTVGSGVVEFEYEDASGLLTFNLVEMPLEHEKFHSVEIEL